MNKQNSTPREAEFSSSVATYFDDLAPIWQKNYSSQGAMLTRIERFARALANNGVNTGRLLDYGCGSGALSSAYAQRGYQVTACDISPQMLAVARREHGEAIRWVPIDPQQARLPFDDASHEAVIASSVLEYVPDPERLLGEFQRILAPGGVLLCSVPDERHVVRQDEGHWLEAARRPFRRLLLALSPRFMPMRRRYDYLSMSVTRWTPEEWIEAFARAGLPASAPEQCDDPLMIVTGVKEATLAR
jgi:ubiquinone/menaquinone biosynthesis C-methylase UbiE